MMGEGPVCGTSDSSPMPTGYSRCRSMSCAGRGEAGQAQGCLSLYSAANAPNRHHHPAIHTATTHDTQQPTPPTHPVLGQLGLDVWELEAEGGRVALRRPRRHGRPGNQEVGFYEVDPGPL